MTVDWGLVSVAVALASLPLVLSDRSGNVIQSTASRLFRIASPSNAQCERLTWADIPTGILHQCFPTMSCFGHGGHQPGARCWVSTLATFYSRAWTSPARRAKLAQKPIDLPTLQEFLVTDVRTLLAFVFCSVPDESSSTWQVFKDGITCDATKLRLEEQHGLLTAHVSGSMRRARFDMTKEEVQKLLNGYPPFYRAFVKNRSGRTVPHPITEWSDIWRGGWVVAVGFSDDSPLALYVTPQPKTISPGDYDADGIRRLLDPLMGAVVRVRDVLRDCFLPCFPSDANLKAVLDAMDYMIRTRTGSAVEKYLPGLRCPGGDTNLVTAPQCMVVMRIFNSLAPLTPEQVAEIGPILPHVLTAAFFGAYKVVQYIKDTGMRLHLPELLRDLDRTVYLMGCGESTDG